MAHYNEKTPVPQESNFNDGSETPVVSMNGPLARLQWKLAGGQELESYHHDQTHSSLPSPGGVLEVDLSKNQLYQKRMNRKKLEGRK